MHAAGDQNYWLRRYEAYLALEGKAAQFLPFTYTFPFTNPIAAGPNTTVNASIQTDTDSDFGVLEPMRQVSDDDAVRTNDATPAMLHELKIETGGRLLDDRQFAVQNFFGTAERPHKLAVPLIVPPAATLTMTLVNDDNVAKRVSYSLVGVKVFITSIRSIEEKRRIFALLGIPPWASDGFAEDLVRAREFAGAPGRPFNAGGLRR